jgi:hypothetical protein
MAMLRTALRVVAIAIAVAGAIDPSFTAERPVKPDVALVAAARLPDPALTDRVARALDDRFTVIRGPSLGAAAVVSIGDQLPPETVRDLRPAFAVLPEPRAPFVSILSIDAPDRAQLQARVPVHVRVQVRAARGRELVVTLDTGGVTVDRVTRPISSDDQTDDVEVVLVATAAGTTSGVVTAAIGDVPDPVHVDLSLAVGDGRWAVLFFDPRPSWMSTFVRRAIESDPRFVVSSRTATSRGAAVTAGSAPAALASLPPLELFDAVVAGAPEDLTAADVAGLEAFMRQRGGTAVLMFDAVSTGRPFERLTGVTTWSNTTRADPIGQPMASEFFWPAVMPPWANGIPAATDPPASPAPPAMWRTAVGRGRLLVSGALDAWRYRDRQADAFDKFWRDAIAESAAAAPPPPDRAAVDRTTPSSMAPLLAARLPTPDDRARIRDWTASHHGQTLPESRISALSAELERALSPASERREIHPMASAWWIVPVAAALGGEWWLRRRRGQR